MNRIQKRKISPYAILNGRSYQYTIFGTIRIIFFYCHCISIWSAAWNYVNALHCPIHLQAHGWRRPNNYCCQGTFFPRGKHGLATFRLPVLPSAIVSRRIIRGTVTRSAACQMFLPSQKAFWAWFISSAINKCSNAHAWSQTTEGKFIIIIIIITE